MGKVRGKPDGTGPYGRGMGPGGGKADGSGLRKAGASKPAKRKAGGKK